MFKCRLRSRVIVEDEKEKELGRFCLERWVSLPFPPTTEFVYGLWDESDLGIDEDAICKIMWQHQKQCFYIDMQFPDQAITWKDVDMRLSAGWRLHLSVEYDSLDEVIDGHWVEKGPPEVFEDLTAVLVEGKYYGLDDLEMRCLYGDKDRAFEVVGRIPDVAKSKGLSAD